MTNGRGRRRGSGRRRDADRSRKAILDAAEAAFAQRGYAETTLAAIAEAADVSAALPAYFFASKSELYDAVIDRMFVERNERLEAISREAIDALDDTADGLRRGLRILVGGYLEFLLERPSFVQLMARDALSLAAAGRAQQPRHSAAYEEGVRKFLMEVGPAAGPAVDSAHLLLTVVAICFFPMEHDATMVAGMGMRAWTPAFVGQRTDHVVDLLMRVMWPAGTGGP